MSISGDQSNSTFGGNFSSSDSTPGFLTIQWTATVILTLIICALTVLLGIHGNSAVVCLTGFKMKRNVETVCFLNLAVVDLTYCLILPFLVAFLVLQGSWHLDYVLQKMLLSTVTLNMSASTFLLTVISICRCLAVTRPIWFRQDLRLAWVFASYFGAWCMALLTCQPALLIEQILPYLGNNAGVTLKVTWTGFTFGIPFAIMAACYLLIARQMRGDRSGKSRKPVRLIVTVVVAFIVCWLPSNVCGLLPAFSQPVPWDWMFVSFGLASFNSALKPLLYVFVGREFRQVFRRSLAASLRLAFADEVVTVGKRPSDPTSPQRRISEDLMRGSRGICLKSTDPRG